MTNFFTPGRLSHLPILSAYLNQVVPCSPALHQFLLGEELELRAQKGPFLCRQFSLTSAMDMLLHEGSCCGCGWEEIYLVEIGYLDIKLISWQNLGQNTLLVGNRIKSSWWPT